jgi:uncharacterized membrane protein YtjA (UPF0391 family)
MMLNSPGGASTTVPFDIITRPKEIDMLSYSLSFLVLAIVAGFLGFGLIAGTAAWIAKVLFGVFIVLFFVSLLTGRRTTAV